MKVSIETKKKFDDANSQRKYAFLKKRAEILLKLPQVDALMTDIDSVWLECIRKGSSQAAAEKKASKLRKQIQEILAENGYSPEDMEYKPSCEICADTGFIGGKVCKCLERFTIEENYSDSSLKNILRKENFASFDETLFSDYADGKNISPRKSILNARKRCETFINNFGKQNENLLIIGKAGTGKTFLTHCIADELIKKGFSVLYTSAYGMITRLTKAAIGEEDDAFERYINGADLLIIDDLGTERLTDFSESQLYNILNARLTSEKSIVISTNCNVADINEKYGERIVSRIFGNFTGVAMHDEDVRLKKKR